MRCTQSTCNHPHEITWLSHHSRYWEPILEAPLASPLQWWKLCVGNHPSPILHESPQVQANNPIKAFTLGLGTFRKFSAQLLQTQTCHKSPVYTSKRGIQGNSFHVQFHSLFIHSFQNYLKCKDKAQFKLLPNPQKSKFCLKAQLLNSLSPSHTKS